MVAASEYAYASGAPAHSTDYVLPAALKLLPPPGARVFDLGCGNGANARTLSAMGYDVVAVDPSESGIAFAKTSDSRCRFAVGSAYDALADQFGLFDAVLSLEVVEHLYSPRIFAQTVKSLLKPGGVAVLSTPYHSYLKNLALALTGKMEAHFSALWDHGHIKFWSRHTLGALMAEVGLHEIAFVRVGRVPALAKSMVCAYR